MSFADHSLNLIVVNSAKSFSDSLLFIGALTQLYSLFYSALDYTEKVSAIVFFYLPYLSSIHEKANCIAIFWTGRPQSLRSCHFRGVWVTCLPHEGGGVSLSALSKDTTSELAGFFSTTSSKCRAPSKEAVDTIF